MYTSTYEVCDKPLTTLMCYYFVLEIERLLLQLFQNVKINKVI